MILTQNQMYRYMQHIVIPEISGIGQKKIIDSAVILYSENLDKASLALYYLAAAGIGEITCHVDNYSNWDDLSGKLSDLNSDVKLQLQNEESEENSNVQATTRVITGSPDYVWKTLNGIIKSDSAEKYMPTIISVYNGWRGAVKTFMEKADLEGYLSEVVKLEDLNNSNFDNCDHMLSGYFSSLMAVVEHLKLTLSLGKPLSNFLYHDLSTMEFDSIDNYSDLFKKLNSYEPSEDFLEVFAASKVLIVGCGGLGSSAAYALASLGIGRLGLVDFDTVELSNLNRQILHSSSRIGMSKVKSSEIFLRQINPSILLDIYDSRAEKESIHDIVKKYDIVMGCLDNLPDRYMLNDACYEAGKPLLEADAFDISGLATSIIPGEGHCYRCIFPEAKDKDPSPSCSETGVLGPVPGLMGIVQAAEAVKLLTGIGKSLKNRILLFDVFDTDIYISENAKYHHCKLCGDK